MKATALPIAMLATLMASGVSHGQHVTTDRVSAESSATVAFATSFWDLENINVTGLRLDMHAQYMHPLPVGNVGGFVMLPLSYAILGADDVPGMTREIDNELDMGNLELAGVFARGIDAGVIPLQLIGRVGVAIGTADDEDTEPAGFEGAGNLATVFSRLTDSSLVVPDSTWIRASGSVLGELQGFQFRSDLGIDVPVTDDESTDVDPFGRLNLAALYDAGPAGFGAELATLMRLGDVADADDRFLHTAAVVITTGLLPSVTPTVGLVLPLDESIDQLGHDFSLALGVTGTLP